MTLNGIEREFNKIYQEIYDWFNAKITFTPAQLSNKKLFIKKQKVIFPLNNVMLQESAVFPNFNLYNKAIRYYPEAY